MTGDPLDSLGPAIGGIVRERLIETLNRRSLRNAIRENRGTGRCIIAEVKPASPSKGDLKPMTPEQVPGLVRTYSRAGAVAISILVEERGFKGSMAHLRAAHSEVHLPLLAKGFLFERRHIAHCAANGADAYLLMVRVLTALDKDVSELIAYGKGLGLEPVLEANDEEEIRLALDAGANIVLVNNRDIYGDLSCDLGRSILGKDIPEDVVFISASGISKPEDIDSIVEFTGGRVDAFLIGSSLMQEENADRLLEALVDRAREAGA